MRRISGITLAGTVALAASLLLAGCGGAASGSQGNGASASSKAPITIGVFGPLSGSLAVAGQHQLDGATYAADLINAKGGADGHQIRIVSGDTQGVPADATSVVNRFIYQDHVTALLGSPNSPEVLAILNLDKKAKVVLLDPSGVAMAITQSGDPYVFRIVATDKIFSQKLVDYALQTLKFKKIAVLYDTSDYGQGGEQLVTAELKAAGVQPVTVQGYNDNTNDFTSQLLAIKNAGAQAIILWGLYTQGAEILHQMQTLGMHTQVLASTGVTIGNFFQLAGSAANGMIGATAGYSPLRTDATAQNFIHAFQAKMHYVPDLNDVLAYDAVNVLAKAVETAHSTNEAKIRAALAGIQNYPGVGGPITFQKNGDGGTAALLFRVENGKEQLLP